MVSKETNSPSFYNFRKNDSSTSFNLNWHELKKALKRRNETLLGVIAYDHGILNEIVRKMFSFSPLKIWFGRRFLEKHRAESNNGQIEFLARFSSVEKALFADWLEDNVDNPVLCSFFFEFNLWWMKMVFAYLIPRNPSPTSEAAKEFDGLEKKFKISSLFTFKENQPKGSFFDTSSILKANDLKSLQEVVRLFVFETTSIVKPGRSAKKEMLPALFLYSQMKQDAEIKGCDRISRKNAKELENVTEVPFDTIRKQYQRLQKSVQQRVNKELRNLESGTDRK